MSDSTDLDWGPWHPSEETGDALLWKTHDFEYRMEGGELFIRTKKRPSSI